jgi:hypothetical protein
VLVYLGAERFIDVRGMRLLLDVAGQVRYRGGSLVVVAPPRSLQKMLHVLDLGGELSVAPTPRHAVRRTRPRSGDRPG